MGRQTILLASSNSGKLQELQLLLQDVPANIVGPGQLPSSLPDSEETGATFMENAMAKALSAVAATQRSGSDLWTLADDSGLQVDALGGAPGVRSARFSGAPGPAAARDRQNLELLLQRLEGVPTSRRTAHFACAMALAGNGRILLAVEGMVDGRIFHQSCGTGGFGYDPIFYHEPSGKTFAQMTPEEKGAISHRGLAIRRLERELRPLLSG